MAIKHCVICQTKFDAQGKDITCGALCRKSRDNQRANEWYHKSMKDEEYRIFRAQAARGRYKEKGR